MRTRLDRVVAPLLVVLAACGPEESRTSLATDGALGETSRTGDSQPPASETPNAARPDAPTSDGASDVVTEGPEVLKAEVASADSGLDHTLDGGVPATTAPDGGPDSALSDAATGDLGSLEGNDAQQLHSESGQPPPDGLVGDVDEVDDGSTADLGAEGSSDSASADTIPGEDDVSLGDGGSDPPADLGAQPPADIGQELGSVADGAGDGAAYDAGEGGAEGSCGFARRGSSWALPTEFSGQFAYPQDMTVCGSGLDVLHATMDLTGDGLPDLVVVSGCEVDDTIGRTHWRLYRNTGSGFAAGVDWALPSEFVGQFDRTAEEGVCNAAPDVLHATMDLTGDGKPDLVVLDGCEVDDTIGQTHWRVFANTGSGFASTGVDFALPTEFIGQFNVASDVQYGCGFGPDVLHTTLDLTGDGLPDLVVVGGCAVDADIGTKHWRVFRNEGTRFAQTGTNYLLPSEFAGQFNNVAVDDACTADGYVSFATMDVTGEGRPDLVVYNGCAVDDSIGRTHWRVFAGADGGFAAGSDYALPGEFVGQFGALSTPSCSWSEARHTVLDIDGDRRPDLVVLSSCTEGEMLGRTHWRIFRNDGTRFATSGSDFALPEDYAQQFVVSEDLSPCNAAPDVLHTTMDLDGDHRPELLVVNGCEADESIGATRWVRVGTVCGP